MLIYTLGLMADIEVEIDLKDLRSHLCNSIWRTYGELMGILISKPKHPEE